MPSLPPIAALIVAAGRGQRVGGDIPKQYRMIAGSCVLAQTLSRFGAVAMVERILSVIHSEDSEAYSTAADQSGLAASRLMSVHGGPSRQSSVRSGLEALAADGFPEDGLVLIHDAARPFASETVLLRAIMAAARFGAAIPVLAVPDTLAILDDTGRLTGNHDRATTRLVQTPQAFRFGVILAAHRRAAVEMRPDFTDDASLARAFGVEVHSFEGDLDLFKITHEADLARAEHWLAARRSSIAASDVRAGIGYDVHAFREGDHVVLGGVAIPHSHALLGHSDADPVLHALTDALLGTIGDGDIGMHFPPSDPKWRGAASHLFLEDAARRVTERGGRIISVDCTIVCESPKIGPHRLAIQQQISAILGLTPDRVGVKATTSEGLGFTGRREGIAAIAIASVAF